MLYNTTQYHTRSYIHTSIHPSIHLSIHTYIHASIHPYIHTFIHPSLHTYIHAYIHTSIHPYIKTYRHIFIFRFSGPQKIGSPHLRPVCDWPPWPLALRISIGPSRPTRTAYGCPAVFFCLFVRKNVDQC